MQHGGDVNASDNTKQTALHWAAVKGSVDVADLLLLHGARIEADDMNGYRVKNPFFLLVTNLYCMSKDLDLCFIIFYLVILMCRQCMLLLNMDRQPS